ncbi:MAG: DUF4254 domain-containing protein [Elusimicrobia bacterium]|nr:DUF4254 domain-containing protein [Elusimicrobiota bacterium]
MAETIGSLVDKISIFELKIYHMSEQIHRDDASPQHRELCKQRLKILKQQRDDLVEELNQLYADIKEGRKKIKIYRQFKMYNDPSYRIKSQ